MDKHDSTYRMAKAVWKQLGNRERRSPNPEFNYNIESVELAQKSLARHRQWIKRARQLGFKLTVARLESDLPLHIDGLKTVLDKLSHCMHNPPRPSYQPTLKDVIDDLVELQDEFEDVSFEWDKEDGKHRIVVTTEEIVLEDIVLGAFDIRLRLDVLCGSSPGSGWFSCIARDPNPAAKHHGTTHPHVRDNGLCPGDASAPITAALTEGRLCDAFSLVNGVLTTYNSGAPYVSLEEWTDGEDEDDEAESNTVLCRECDAELDPDQGETNNCQGCDHVVCDDCILTCDGCDEHYCRGCLERDEVAGMLYCSSCWTKCTRCERITGNDDIDDDNGMCPGCRELAAAEAQEQ